MDLRSLKYFVLNSLRVIIKVAKLQTPVPRLSKYGGPTSPAFNKGLLLAANISNQSQMDFEMEHKLTKMADKCSLF